MLPVEIRPLCMDTIDDYFRFFDDVAFADHPEWSWCYCTYFHMDQDDERAGDIQCKDDLRKLAYRLIEAGTLRGYLAYREGEVVGWCNVNDKKSFKRLKGEADLWTTDEPGRIKAVTCFTIAPGLRRQGIARRLLERAVADAAAEGYALMEAYPVDEAPDSYDHFHGHAAMYKACGFVPIRRTSFRTVMQKPLV